MSLVRFVRLFSVLALAFWASTLSATTVTYAVGTCRPHIPSYPTISAALAATPVANVVEVCPGTYKEQLQITHPITLEGVSNGTSVQAIIAPPSSGLVVNATNDEGIRIAAQLWVNNASGPVNISDLTLDANGNGVPFDGPFVVGIFYQNSSGTVNRVATRNQSGNNNGVGIWAQGGSSNPFVTIENSSVHDYDNRGILVEETSSSTPELTAVIRGNEVTTSKLNGQVGISNEGGDAVTVTSNLIVVNSGSIGIQDYFPGPDSISANTVVNGLAAIFVPKPADSFSVTSNKIFGSYIGIAVGGGNFGEVGGPAIQGNSITNSSFGIGFGCNADPNVHSNIINDAGTALNLVPSAVTTRNTYFNVGTIRSGGC